MYRIKQLTSKTHVWKSPMKDWQRLYQIDRLRQVICKSDSCLEKAMDEDTGEAKQEEGEEEADKKESKEENKKDEEGGELERELTKEIEKMLEEEEKEETDKKSLLKKRKYAGKSEEEIVRDANLEKIRRGSEAQEEGVQ